MKAVKSVHVSSSMWRRATAAALVAAVGLVSQAHGQAIWSFETGLEGWSAVNAVLTQTTNGATDGTMAMQSAAPGNFQNDIGTTLNFGPDRAGFEDAFAKFDLAATEMAAGRFPNLEFDLKIDTSMSGTTGVFAQLGLFTNSHSLGGLGGFTQYGTGGLIGGNIGSDFPRLDAPAVADGVTLTNTGPDQYHLAIPMGMGKSISLSTVAAGNTFYDIGFKSNGGYTGTIKYIFDNIRITGIPTYTPHTLFSWETPDNPSTPTVNEAFEGWVTTNELPSPPAGVTLQPGHAQSIVATGATDGTHAYQIDRRSLPNGFTWGSQFGLSGAGNPAAQTKINELVSLINGADRVAFDVTYRDMFNAEGGFISPSFTNFAIHFADGTGAFYQASTAGLDLNQAGAGKTTTLEIPLSAFNDATTGSTKNLAVDGLLVGATVLEIGIATSTDDGGIYQIDNFRVLTRDSALAADFDDDGSVDGEDLAVWKTAFVTTPAGDADGDGDSDGNDFLIWQRELGSPAASAAASAVPEPAAAWLALCGSLAVIRRRRA
jgi:hypothetical protein